MSIEKPMDALLEARLQFRNLLDTHGLALLAGSEGDAIMWLEQETIHLVNSLSRRQRFLGLLRQAREILTREQDPRHRNEDPPGCEGIGKFNPYSGRRFRRIKI